MPMTIMKEKYLLTANKLIALIALLLAVSFYSCDKNPADDIIDEGDASEITMFLKGNYINFSLAGVGDATIDWGDGKQTETISLTSESANFPYNYPDNSDYKVIIRGNIKQMRSWGYELSIDVSNCTTIERLTVSWGPIEEVIVGKNQSLKSLGIYNWTQIKSLDISGSAIDTLICRRGEITNLNVTGCVTLKHLECIYQNITTLDLSTNTALTYLSVVNNNPKFETLNVSANTALTYLSCSDVLSLNVSNNTKLTELYVWGHQLTSLDVSKNTALEILHCYLAPLTDLDLSKNTALKELVCFETQLTNLDISKNTALKKLECENNQLINLDVSKNIALEYLKCCDNQLTNLDVSANTALVELWCRNNQLTNLDLSKNNAIKELICNKNQLTSLDLSRCNDLRCVIAYNNQLTKLVLNSKISLVDIYTNKLSAETLNVLFYGLRNIISTPGAYDSGTLCIGNNPGTDDCDKSIAENKNWTVFDDDTYWSVY